MNEHTKHTPGYHDFLVAAARTENGRIPHWAIARAHFERLKEFYETMDELIEQENHWWQQLDDDAEAGLLEEWTDGHE
jgi:hypothetical protein